MDGCGLTTARTALVALMAIVVAVFAQLADARHLNSERDEKQLRSRLDESLFNHKPFKFKFDQSELAVVQAKFTQGGSPVSGSATVIGPRRPDGRWNILTACCVCGDPGDVGEIRTSNSTHKVKVSKVCANSQVAWLVTLEPVENLSHVFLAESSPVKSGQPCWHNGHGVCRDMRKREGETRLTVPGKQFSGKWELHVTYGDAGGAVFGRDNRVIGVVACTEDVAKKSNVYGPSVEQARELLDSKE